MTFSSGYRLYILSLIFFSILWLCLFPLKANQFGPRSDEGYYYAYANYVKDTGRPAFKKLVSWYSSSEEAMKHPTPMRAGYIVLTGLLFTLFGPSFQLLGLCSTLSFLIFLYVCFYYTRKYFDLDTALLTVLLLSSSPLMLGLSRRALIDSPINLLWGTLVWLFFDFLHEPKKWKYVSLIVGLAFAITVKEMSLVLLPFFVIAGLWLRPVKDKVSIGSLFGLAAWVLGLVFLFYWWIFGDIGVLASILGAIIKVHLSPSSSNPYAMDFSSGPWFRYILDFLLLNPIVTVLFIAYLGFQFGQKFFGDIRIKYFLFYFIFIYTCLSALPHSKVVRFVLNLEMVMALFAVLMVSHLFKGEDNRRNQRWIVLVVFGIFTYNWLSFMNIFYFPGLLDPISYHLLVLRHFIPSF